MTLKEAYIYVFAILDGYFQRKPNDELAEFLGCMNLWSSLWDYETPANPAFWNDWVKSVKKVTSKDNIDDVEALFACVHMLRAWDEIALKKVISSVEEKANKLSKLKEINKINKLEWQKRQSQH
jgi:hypothetical protein